MTTRVPLEGDYQRALLARCALEFRDVRFFRRNTGMIQLEERVFRAGIPGQCDLYAIGRGGRHYEIEIKRFGKLSPAQEAWRDWCKQWGVPWTCLSVKRGEPVPETMARWMGELAEFFAHS